MYEILVRSGMMCVVEMCEILEAWEVMIWGFIGKSSVFPNDMTETYGVPFGPL
jgi:hypothetical protein